MTKNNDEVTKSKNEDEVKKTEEVVVEETTKTIDNDRNKILEEFARKYLDGLTYDKDTKLKISGEEMEFGISTNNILYDADLTEEEFNKKVEFLHNKKSQDTVGVKFQYRVITRKEEKFVIKFKSDRYVVGAGRVGRTKEIMEV